MAVGTFLGLVLGVPILLIAAAVSIPLIPVVLLMEGFRNKPGPRKLSMVFSPLFVLALLVYGAVSMPAMAIIVLIRRRQEKNFANAMSRAGRSMSWMELEAAIAKEQGGTVIAEWLSGKGPCRIWWTLDNVRAVSSEEGYSADRSPDSWPPPQFGPEFTRFCEWCYARFTNPKSGKAKLVSVPEERKRTPLKHLPGSSVVSIYSPPKLRKKLAGATSQTR